MKTMLFFFAVALVLAGCSEDKNPPGAGFSLSSAAVIQWDIVTITSDATGADETTYAVTGGTYEMDDVAGTIQLLEAATYTVTQTVTNADGSDEISVEVVATAPDNTYSLDGGTEISLGNTDQPNAYWYDATGMGGTIYIRFLADVAGQDNPDLIKLYPVAGPNPLQATYTWSDAGEIGTYDAGMTADYAGMSFGWTSFGTAGNDLVITLVYEATDSDNNIYDIVLSSSTLEYGNYDALWNWVSEGTKTLVVSYRGKIDPVG